MPYKDPKKKQAWHRKKLAADPAYAASVNRSKRASDQRASGRKLAERLGTDPDFAAEHRHAERMKADPEYAASILELAAERRDESERLASERRAARLTINGVWTCEAVRRLSRTVAQARRRAVASAWDKKISNLARGLRLMAVRAVSPTGPKKRPPSDWTTTARLLAARINMEAKGGRPGRTDPSVDRRWQWRIYRIVCGLSLSRRQTASASPKSGPCSTGKNSDAPTPAMS